MDDPFDCAPLLESDAALKPFLQAGQESSSASFSTLAALVAKVLSHADIFAGYDQLKAVLLEPIQRTAPNGDKGEEILRTLDLFSHGTYADYVAGGGTKFMTLSDSQVFKLRQLTVLSLVQAACLQKLDYLDYSTVEQAIVLESSSVAASSVEKLRAVETILISCMYSGAVSGRLCQKTQSLRFVMYPWQLLPICWRRYGSSNRACNKPSNTWVWLMCRCKSRWHRTSSIGRVSDSKRMTSNRIVCCDRRVLMPGPTPL
jgi:hypothetical protein